MALLVQAAGRCKTDRVVVQRIEQVQVFLNRNPENIADVCCFEAAYEQIRLVFV